MSSLGIDRRTVEAVASDGGKQVATISGAAGTELKLAIPNPKLWAPGSPHLYEFKIRSCNGHVAFYLPHPQ